MILRRGAADPIEFDGLEIIEYTAERGMSSSIAEITVPAGVSHKLSWSNRSDKYYYVVQGEVSFTVGEESSDLVSGDVCVVSIGEQFSYTNTGSGDAILILVHTPSFKLECEVFKE
jgi:mannose-6-phosphate isomerase-like protein (cupin superfamily)